MPEDAANGGVEPSLEEVVAREAGIAEAQEDDEAEYPFAQPLPVPVDLAAALHQVMAQKAELLRRYRVRASMIGTLRQEVGRLRECRDLWQASAERRQKRVEERDARIAELEAVVTMIVAQTPGFIYGLAEKVMGDAFPSVHGLLSRLDEGFLPDALDKSDTHAIPSPPGGENTADASGAPPS